MTCPVGEQLRSAWYATATLYDAQKHLSVTDALHSDQKRSDYQQKLAVYRHHRANCPECRKDVE